VVEVAMHPGKPLTRKAAAESPASSSKMAPAKAATHVAAAKSAPNMSASESTTHVSASESTTHVSATESTTHVAATESTTHVAATESTTHVATTKSAATTAAMSSGQSIRRNRHRAHQQSRSSHNTKITLHEYLQWFDQFTLIVHEHISGSAGGTIKLAFRKLNSILSEQIGKRSAVWELARLVRERR
jgi:hypothetical protein